MRTSLTSRWVSMDKPLHLTFYLKNQDYVTTSQ